MTAGRKYPLTEWIASLVPVFEAGQQKKDARNKREITIFTAKHSSEITKISIAPEKWNGSRFAHFLRQIFLISATTGVKIKIVS